MFSRQHRKAKVLFGVSDVLLTALAFEAAYQTRLLLHLQRAFFFTVSEKALLLVSRWLPGSSSASGWVYTTSLIPAILA